MLHALHCTCTCMYMGHWLLVLRTIFPVQSTHNMCFLSDLKVIVYTDSASHMNLHIYDYSFTCICHTKFYLSLVMVVGAY